MSELRRAVSGVLTELGLADDAPWFEGCLGAGGEAPDGASGGVVRVREVGAESGPDAVAAEEGYWLYLSEGDTRLAPLRGGGSGVVLVTQQPLRCSVSVREQELPEDGHARKTPSRHAFTVELCLADERRFAVGEWWARDRATARMRAEAACGRLVQWLGALLPNAVIDTPQLTESTDVPLVPLPAATMSRLVFRREGAVVVLRDMASRGPRELAYVELALTLFFTMAAGLATWCAFRVVQPLHVGVLAAVAVVLALAAYASAHIARHSMRYVLHNEAILYFGADRFVLAPWVSRQGVVDDKAEGRYGAALPYAEWTEVTIETKANVHRLLLATDHGPYEICSFADPQFAEAWRARLLLFVADMSANAEREGDKA